MEIKFGRQISLSDISDNIDLFLLAGNHEKRFLTSFNKISKQNTISRTIALCYNSTFCQKLPKSITKKIIGNQNEIFSLLDEELRQKNGEFIIFIDYSCMTKPWYYSIILYLSKKQLALDRLRVFFSYTPSKYSPPQPPKPNTEIIPLPGKYIVPTSKPKALIVCLGYEQQKAEGIIEHLDPKLSYIFYTKPAFDNRFVTTLEVNNESILNDPSKIIKTYQFDDLLGLERQLTSIYESIKNDYSIIFAPLGPKPFTFISMLMSVKYPDIDVWRVGSGSDINEYKREPIKDNLFIITEILFANQPNHI
ncbi:MAG: hypothetical protein JWQ09_4777 [Segetibacter sp.]|nr:hypothetical protein [Segetibacter sp.]